MKEYILFIMAAFVFGSLCGGLLVYKVIDILKKGKRDKKFNDDCVNNGK
jgi:hypothetical protein